MGADTVCTGYSMTLSDSSSGGIWSISNGNAHIGPGVVAGIDPGQDTVFYTITNACGTPTTAEKTITIMPESYCTTGIPPTGAAQQSLSVFPNPAGNVITVVYNGGLHEIEITNILGQTMYTETITTTLHQRSIDITAMPAGIYFVKVNGNEVRKFVKE
jgi:hypothetical protein